MSFSSFLYVLGRRSSETRRSESIRITELRTQNSVFFSSPTWEAPFPVFARGVACTRVPSVRRPSELRFDGAIFGLGFAPPILTF